MMTEAAALAREYDMFPPGSTVLCAVSGGADSMCLLAWLAGRGDIKVVCAHFDHGLRGEESQRDAAFVQAWCAGANVPFYLGRGDVKGEAARTGQGLEETGRMMRYAFLRETARRVGAQVIATAHTADDNAETLLLHLLRGSGLRGLGGIPPRRGELVRPLLTTTRAEILAFLEEKGVPHVEDSSNQTDDFLRNKVRHRLVPLLQELNPRAVEHINAAAAQAREVDDYLDQQAKAAFTGLGTGPGWVSLPWEDLQRAPAPLRPRLLQLLLDRMEVGRKDFGTVHFDAVLSLENECSVDLPHGVTARRERGRLFLTRRQMLPAQAVLRKGSPFRWGDYTLTLWDRPAGEGLALWVPEGAELTVGPCPAGERLTLPGSKGARTVKRLCLDEGISLAEREGLPAIYVNRRLAAVWRLGVDLEFSPGPGKDFTRSIQIQKDRRENMTNIMENDIQEILLSEEELKARVAALGQEISADYAGKEPVLVSVLRGSYIFMADLSRALTIPCTVDFMAVSSYGSGTTSSGQVNIIKDLSDSIEGKDLLIVEDILDSGNTLFYLLQVLQARHPASIKLCTLLDKPARRVKPITADYSGFEIPDGFVVGYGLDYDEKYRNLPYIGILKPCVYEK